MNILGLHVFPGIDRVTDELVLRTPDDWDLADLADLVERLRSGPASACSRATARPASADQPTRYVLAARSILAEPAGFPERGGPPLRRRGGHVGLGRSAR